MNFYDFFFTFNICARLMVFYHNCKKGKLLSCDRCSKQSLFITSSKSLERQAPKEYEPYKPWRIEKDQLVWDMAFFGLPKIAFPGK